MREIKFRAWDKQNKLMRQLEVAFFGKNGYFITDKEAGRGFLPSNKIEEFELMQFTGLNDKNGKYIFEGDILKRHRPDLGVVETSLYILDVFEQGSFWARVEGRDYKVSASIIADGNFEIVGNIYENKDLLV